MISVSTTIVTESSITGYSIPGDIAEKLEIVIETARDPNDYTVEEMIEIMEITLEAELNAESVVVPAESIVQLTTWGEEEILLQKIQYKDKVVYYYP